jgi:hypothetical protein
MYFSRSKYWSLRQGQIEKDSSDFKLAVHFISLDPEYLDIEEYWY